MKIELTPFFDTDNSDPPDATFDEGHHTIMIQLRNPRREIQIEKADFRRLVRFFVEDVDAPR